ncbi:MAG: TIGR04283 family arsenosugar biosynthesis glycosyltransferase [Acidobacteriota bacterium]
MREDEGAGSGRGPALSVVIPALNEEEALPGLLASLESQGVEPPFEVILADGGSTDGTVGRFLALVRDWPERGLAAGVLASPAAGRALQMNSGARAARGGALLFLHADSRLRPGAIRCVLRALEDPRVVGGGFRHRFRERGPLLRLISAWATARSLVRRVHYGDQAIFVRRSTFESIGGFPEIPLFEDLRLSLAIKRCGRVRTLAMPVETSARRLRRGGVARTAARFAWLKFRYALGADPSRLRSRYPDVR